MNRHPGCAGPAPAGCRRAGLGHRLAGKDAGGPRFMVPMRVRFSDLGACHEPLYEPERGIYAASTSPRPHRRVVRQRRETVDGEAA